MDYSAANLSLWNFILLLQVWKTLYSRDADAWQGATLQRPHSCPKYTQSKGPRLWPCLPAPSPCVLGSGAVMVNLTRQLDGSGESRDIWVCL